jgi:hypothetical protein
MYTVVNVTVNKYIIYGFADGWRAGEEGHQEERQESLTSSFRSRISRLEGDGSDEKIMALGAMLAMMLVAASLAMALDRDDRGDRVENRIENRVDRFEDRFDVDFDGDFADDFDGFGNGSSLISSDDDFDEIEFDDFDDLEYFVVYEYDDGEFEVEEVYFV